MHTVPRINRAIEWYLVAKASGGHSKHSISTTRWALDILVDFLGDVPVDQINHRKLQRFMAYVMNDYVPTRPDGNEEPLAPSSVVRIWSSIRGFFNWGEVELNLERPDLRLEKPRYKNPTVKAFTKEEIAELIKASEYTKVIRRNGTKAYRMKRPTASRDKAVILLLLDTGIRAGECARLQVEDVDLKHGEIEIKPYGSSIKSRPRMVYIGNGSKNALWRYLISRGEPLPEDPLFVTIHNRQMNRNTIRHLLRRIGESCGVPKVYPHRFRHTFAIQYLRNGGDPFTLQKLLGHSTLEMTRRYLDIVRSDAANAHRSASPVDRWRL